MENTEKDTRKIGNYFLFGRIKRNFVSSYQIFNFQPFGNEIAASVLAMV